MSLIVAHVLYIRPFQPTFFYHFAECEDQYRDCEEWIIPTYGCDVLATAMVCRKSCNNCGMKLANNVCALFSKNCYPA